MRIALLALLFVGCQKDFILEPNYVTTVDPPEALLVSVEVTDTWTDHTGGGLWRLYSMGTVGNPNDVDVELMISAEVWRGADSVLASDGVIGYGRYADIFTGLVDTVDFIPAHGRVDYWIASRQFIDGATATGRLILNVKER